MESKQKTEYKDGPCWTLLHSGEWKSWFDLAYETENEYYFMPLCRIYPYKIVKRCDIKAIYPCDEHGFIEADLYTPTESDDYLTRCCVNPPLTYMDVKFALNVMGDVTWRDDSLRQDCTESVIQWQPLPQANPLTESELKRYGFTCSNNNQ